MNPDKYAYDDDYQKPESRKREEDLHVRNIAVSGYRIPKKVLDK